MELTHPQKGTISSQVKKLSIKSAVIGSVIFSASDLAAVYIKSNFIEHIKTSGGPWEVAFLLIWFVIVILIGSALSYFPARIFGGILARLLQIDSAKHKLTNRFALIKGGLMGGLAGFLICLPILIAQYIFIEESGHGDFYVFIYRTVTATIIAALAGVWGGLQIKEILVKQPAANKVVS